MSAGIADHRLDRPTPAAVVLREATAAHEVAAANWHLQRERGGIVEATDADDMAHGVKYRGATPAGVAALGAWQKARVELEAATALRRRELERRL